jgi:hypothetical protein
MSQTKGGMAQMQKMMGGMSATPAVVDASPPPQVSARV